jgi:hypothetical protein
MTALLTNRTKHTSFAMRNSRANYNAGTLKKLSFAGYKIGSRKPLKSRS